MDGLYPDPNLDPDTDQKHWFLDKKIYLKPLDVKLECEKLAQEKTEMQRHYVMVSIFGTTWINR